MIFSPKIFWVHQMFIIHKKCWALRSFRSKQILRLKIIWVWKKKLGQKYFWVKKKTYVKKILFKKKIGLILGEKMLGPEIILGPKKLLAPKMLCPKKFGVKSFASEISLGVLKNLCVQANFVSKEIGDPTKFYPKNVESKKCWSCKNY